MSRMSSLLRQSIAVASLESENVAIDGQPENPYDHIETTPADRGGQTEVEIASAELSARATVSIEEAELSGDLAEAEADLDAGVDAVDELISTLGDEGGRQSRDAAHRSTNLEVFGTAQDVQKS